MPRTYLLQTHEMLFDAHNYCLSAWGGNPRRGVYDDMKTPVDKVRHGKQRQVNARFRAIVGHFLFESAFCNPAAGWEKGQVEKNVRDARQRLRQNAPGFSDLAPLNAWMEKCCQDLWYEIRHPEQSDRTIVEVVADERSALMVMPPPLDGFVEHAKRVSPTCLSPKYSRSAPAVLVYPGAIHPRSIE